MEQLWANCLITWRLTSLLVAERGPYDVFEVLRDFAGIDYNEFSQKIYKNGFAKMLGCFWCCSLWVGLVVALARKRPLWEGLAYSAAAIYLNFAIGEYLG
jgi:hypothetical protein